MIEEFTQPLIALLQQLADVIDRLDDGQYVQKPVGVVPSSVGGHVRHCLDHVRSLLEAIDTGRLNYDTRQRGTPIETDRQAVAEAVGQFVADLSLLADRVIDRDMDLTVTMSPEAEPLQVRTTVGREMAYVLAHTVHHNALIGAMVKTLGGWLPDQFGYAPSTIRHQVARAISPCPAA